MNKVKPLTFDTIENQNHTDTSKTKPLTFDTLEGEELRENKIQSEDENQITPQKTVNFFASIWGLLVGIFFFVLMILIGDFVVSIEDIINNPSLSNILYVLGFLVLLSAVGIHIQKLFLQIKSLKSAEKIKKEYEAQKISPNAEIIKLSSALVEEYKDTKIEDLEEIIVRIKHKLETSPVYEELYKLNEEVYFVIDKKANSIIKNASIQAGVATAISPLPLVDMILTLYRSIYLTNQISKLYGYKPGIITKYSILKQAIFNIAFAGGSEMLLDYIPDIGTSSSLNLFSKSLGQGFANGVLMARIGYSIKKACRPIELDNKKAEKSIIRTLLSEFKKK